jgi:hypothetical protein
MTAILLAANSSLPERGLFVFAEKKHTRRFFLLASGFKLRQNVTIFFNRSQFIVMSVVF